MGIFIVSPEQVATNAFISNLIGQGIHIFIALLSIGEAYVIMRIQRANQRQQDQIDSCYRTLASIADKLDTMNEKLNDALDEQKEGD